MKLVLPPSHGSVPNKSHKACNTPLRKAIMSPSKICFRKTLAQWFARAQTWEAAFDLRLASMEAF